MNELGFNEEDFDAVEDDIDDPDEEVLDEEEEDHSKIIGKICTYLKKYL